MIIFSNQLTEKYAYDLMLFHKCRDFDDGLLFYEFIINYDRYIGDHNPKFEIRLVICNFTVFEFNIYNMFHVENYYG
jgi:hypothetical protein